MVRLFLPLVVLGFSLPALAEPEAASPAGISRPVLDRFLSRAVTHAGLLASSSDPSTPHFEDDLRMLTDIGAKFIGRAAFAWDLPADEEGHFRQTRERAARVHKADPEIVLQACVFEIVTDGVEEIPIPAWVFEEFDRPVIKRNFDYEAMLYRNGSQRNRWRGGASVPDLSRLETRMWFFYRGRRYIDSGCEAIHFGQVLLMDDADPGHRHWFSLLNRLRRYAANHARRGFLLCDAHTHGILRDGELLFDFHSYPLRIREVPGQPQRTRLAADQERDIITRSKGGRTPSGWTCDRLPYLVELDNYGYSGRGGESVGGIWVWGYDEISWFAHQPQADRTAWLRDTFAWLKKTDPVGHLQMPTRRLLAAPVDGRRMYTANKPSDACPHGFDVEETIRSIWSDNPPSDVSLPTVR